MKPLPFAPLLLVLAWLLALAPKIHAEFVGANNKENTLISIAPCQGIAFKRVEYYTDSSTKEKESCPKPIATGWGEVVVDQAAITEYVRRKEGYINVFLNGKPEFWVVNNLRVNSDPLGDVPPKLLKRLRQMKRKKIASCIPQEERPPPISTFVDFEVAVGRDAKEVDAIIVFTKQTMRNNIKTMRKLKKLSTETFPLTGVTALDFGGAREKNDTAFEVEAIGKPTSPKQTSNKARGDWQQWPKYNVEAGVNQCVPVAFANTLAYLETMFGLRVDEPHVAGISIGDRDGCDSILTRTLEMEEPHARGMRVGNRGPSGTFSLPGKLDELMQRDVTSWYEGRGLGKECAMQGLLEYLSKHNKERVIVRHQGWIQPKFEYKGITSYSFGSPPTFKFICDEVKDGNGVVMWYGKYKYAADDPPSSRALGVMTDPRLFDQQRVGGHALRVVGCSDNNGVKKIRAIDDGKQSDPNDGTREREFAAEDLDGDGVLNAFGNDKWELEFVIVIEVLEDGGTNP